MDCTSPRAPNFRHVLRDGFIPRLYRSFLSSLDGQGTWRELMNRLDETSRGDYFRLNIAFSGQEPAIDDIECMNDLRASVHLRPRISRDRKSIASALLASAFFFKLSAIPLFKSGVFHCQGTIRCRLQGTVVVQALARIHSSILLFVTDFGTLGHLNPSKDVCGLCHRYRRHVEFYIRHPSDAMVIYLQSDHHERRKLGGFPQTVDWFIQQQNLDAVFGTANHGAPGRLFCRACGVGRVRASLSTKRPCADIESDFQSKRRRL